MSVHPPQLKGIELRHGVTMRFITNAAFSGDITFQNLLDTFLVATTTTAGVNVFQTVKIRRVRVWANAILGSASSISVEFSGLTAGISGDQQIHTDTSMGVRPAYIDAVPSRRCLASDYQLNSSAIAMNLSVPSGAVIDVELSFRGSFTNNTAEQNALVGATLGHFYLRGLDGLAAATSKFTPEYSQAWQ